MKKTLNKTLNFGIVYLVFFIVALTLIIVYNKGELHLMLTSINSPFLDIFFRIVTELGGSGPVIVGVLFTLYRFGASFYILLTQLINLLITNGLKLYFGIPRPTVYFAENFPDTILHNVEGVTMRLSNGFPSGHTSGVFAMMLCIALIVKNRTLSAILCIVAILVGYSRIYLSQHFAEDVLFGSVIGIISALALYPLYQKLNRDYRWPNQSVITIFKHKK